MVFFSVETYCLLVNSLPKIGSLQTPPGLGSMLGYMPHRMQGGTNHHLGNELMVPFLHPGELQTSILFKGVLHCRYFTLKKKTPSKDTTWYP